MAKYFKVKTNYLKIDPGNENEVLNVSEVRLFEAVDYVDAQKQTIKLINKRGCCGEYDIEIQKVSYDSCLYRNPEGKFELKFQNSINFIKNLETYWYEIKITKIVEDDKGNEKYITSKYLVEGQDLEDAIEVMRSYLKDYLKDIDEDYWWFTSIQETSIEEVILVL